MLPEPGPEGPVDYSQYRLHEATSTSVPGHQYISITIDVFFEGYFNPLVTTNVQ